tara:strand:- start:879 stop:1127 length:249 start_codon:yes stop_codon:yes gene_type:complete
MGPVSITLSVDKDSAATIVDLLAQFPEGSRVTVRITEAPDDPEEVQPPTLPEYEGKVAKPPRELPTRPWKSREEALRDLSVD